MQEALQLGSEANRMNKDTKFSNESIFSHPILGGDGKAALA